jgi:hypothetical protein
MFFSLIKHPWNKWSSSFFPVVQPIGTDLTCNLNPSSTLNFDINLWHWPLTLIWSPCSEYRTDFTARNNCVPSLWPRLTPHPNYLPLPKKNIATSHTHQPQTSPPQNLPFLSLTEGVGGKKTGPVFKTRVLQLGQSILFVLTCILLHFQPWPLTLTFDLDFWPWPLQSWGGFLGW